MNDIPVGRGRPRDERARREPSEDTVKRQAGRKPSVETKPANSLNPRAMRKRILACKQPSLWYSVMTALAG